MGITGVVYGYMRYFAEPADPYAVVNHPWQPVLRDTHIVTAPLLVFAVAWVWQDHVWKRVRSGFRARRSTGLALFALFVPMVLSGYLLQVAVEPAWKNVWIVLHVATSCVWTVGFLVHLVSRRQVLRAHDEPSSSRMRGYTGPSGDKTASRSRVDASR